MAVPLQMSTIREVSFSVESHETKLKTPKGYVRSRIAKFSLDFGVQSQFLLDLTKISKSDISIEASLTKASVTNRSMIIRDSSPLRSQMSQLSLIDQIIDKKIGDTYQKIEEGVKYDLSKSVYERQKEWRQKVCGISSELKLAAKRNHLHELRCLGPVDGVQKWSPRHKSRKPLQNLLRQKIFRETRSLSRLSISPTRTERYETPTKTRPEATLTEKMRNYLDTPVKSKPTRHPQLTVETYS